MVVAVLRRRSYAECLSSDFRSRPRLRWVPEGAGAQAAEQEVEPVAAQAVVEPVVVEPVAVELVVQAELEPAAAEPEAVQAELVPVAAEAAPEQVAAASIGRSNRSPIAPKRLRTTSRRALPASSGAPRSTSACSATAVFCPTPK